MSLNILKIVEKSQNAIKEKLKDKIIQYIPDNFPVDSEGYITFQSISWVNGDLDKIDNSGVTNKTNYINKEYQILVTGKTLNGKSITVRVHGYRPFFYILVPGTWKENHKNKFLNWFSTKCRDIEKDKCIIEKKKKLFPYTGYKRYNFIKLVFKNTKSLNISKYLFRDKITVPDLCTEIKFETYEASVNILNKFCHEKNISTTGFIKIRNFIADSEISTTEYRFLVSESDIFKANDQSINSDFKIFSYDIETQSSIEDQFPNPELIGDYVGQIGISILSFKSKEILKIIISKGLCEDIDDVIVFQCMSEEEVLITYCYIIHYLDPDIITGYNIWNFDDKYIATRMKILNIYKYTWLLSRIRLDLGSLNLVSDYKKQLAQESTAEIKKKFKYPAQANDFVGIISHSLKTSAYGDNNFHILTMPGRESIDLIEIIKKEHKLVSYKLDNVGYEFIKERKEGLTPKDLFKYMASNDASLMKMVGTYCIQDTNLVIKLIMKLLVIQNYIEMAKITFVPLSWLSIRGQQCRVFSLIVKNAKSNNFLVPDSLGYELSENERKYEGALVMEPKIGSHFDPVCCMDFASLYPSIMRAYNLDLSTIMLGKNIIIPDDVRTETITWTEKDNTEKSYTFVQSTNEETRGIVPKILDDLARWRKETKILMAESSQQDIKDVYNSKQLSIKIVMNSIYGFFGSRNNIAFTPIAASVTAKGRQIITNAKKIAEEQFRGDVLYGDSIPGYEKVYINGLHDTIENHISDIRHKGYKWIGYKMFKAQDQTVNHYTKEQINFCDEYNNISKKEFITKTGSGPSPIRRIIRHKTIKKLYKITCIDNTGKLRSITVTEGHSLIDTLGNAVQMTNLKIGQMLP